MVRVEKGSGLSAYLGQPAAIDFTVTYPPHIKHRVRSRYNIGCSSFGRKHTTNDPKCEELGWVCVPMAVERYDGKH